MLKHVFHVELISLFMSYWRFVGTSLIYAVLHYVVWHEITRIFFCRLTKKNPKDVEGTICFVLAKIYELGQGRQASFIYPFV